MADYNPNGRLFIGVFPCGLVYCDTQIEVNRDYKRIAFLPYSTLALEMDDPKSVLMPEIKEHAAKIAARCGQAFQVSQCRQTVMLGGRSV